MPLLTLLLLATVGLNLLLLWLIVRRLFALYLENKSRRRQRFERRLSHFALTPLSKDDILFVGDSITEGGDWQTMFPQYRTRNFGIGSDTSSGVLERIEITSVASPKALFLLIGTNDLSQGLPQKQIIANYGKIIEKLQSNFPQTRLYIQSILPREPQYQYAIEALNQELSYLADECGAKFVELYPKFVGPSGGIQSTLSNDELHLLGSGYRRWQTLLAEQLDASNQP